MLTTLLLCTVVGISDGDTLVARCAVDDRVKKTLKVRLSEIDAPEKGQAFGWRSRQHLAALCHRQAAQLQPVAVDRHQRTVARVHCNGTDAGAAQVRAGLAWVFVGFADKHSALHAMQADAQRHRRGLWADPRPMAPWKWRRLDAAGGQSAPGHPVQFRPGMLGMSATS
jgi:endonuclease YncB( thermonuclease family)